MCFCFVCCCCFVQFCVLVCGLFVLFLGVFVLTPSSLKLAFVQSLFHHFVPSFCRAALSRCLISEVLMRPLPIDPSPRSSGTNVKSMTTLRLNSSQTCNRCLHQGTPRTPPAKPATGKLRLEKMSLITCVFFLPSRQKK